VQYTSNSHYPLHLVLKPKYLTDMDSADMNKA
jgi:hypothetical protein